MRGIYPVTTEPEDDVRAQARLKWLLIAGAVAVGLIIAVAIWSGRPEYPAVTSEESLGLMKLLYAACNTKDPIRLAKVEEGVDKSSRDGKLSPGEQEAFSKIIGMAKGGDWERAEKAAFKFAQDQIGQGSVSTAKPESRKLKR